ncbi:hypothetical protein BU24DRAFT_412333 [Aaosphaeria arxii CBS 175.79]|uniref:Uncharacterized protein n=1 Tax=Aaosphaeria arxii CBS 175.79 TaxID=1450172 RepID=A0A6A5XJL6_9PLEO|nr:uncharacterized protein BU24DRAFT_412333 [Aaosphaeria arxii CBS 175.79]KAF2013031.1 hypothetical protein BU24DRAFT_412333 [Aaosphaeria arxii CBS 175.79]
MLNNIARFALPLLLLGASPVFGRELKPIRPNGARHAKRQQQSDMDRRSVETFLWGDDGVSSVANLTVYMGGSTEGILNMERFDGMLTDIQCGNESISMTFQDDETFAYAQRTWDWVNGAENNSFVMIAGVGDCGNNTRRLPYVVSTMQYDEVANRAVLAARLSDWQAVAHSYDFVVGSVAQDPVSKKAISRRDIDKTTSIDFNHSLNGSVAFSVGDVEARVVCLECGSAGQFDMEFKISQKIGIPTGASMKISPKGVSAVAKMKLIGSVSVTDALEKSIDLLDIPISGLKIPGILDLGPFLTVALAAELSSITVSAAVSMGATAKFSDEAILNVDLLNPDENEFSGWEPTVDVDDVAVEGSINGGVAAFLKPSVNLKAEALGKGFEIGINMKVPTVSARLSAVVSPQGVCPAEGDAPQKTTGVKAVINLGASLNFDVRNTGTDKSLFGVSLAALDRPLAETCFPFGDDVAPAARFRPRGYLMG